MAIQFIDLCSGIGGFHSGLMATGHYECVGHAEIDPNAAKAYKAIYGEEGGLNYGDLREIDPKQLPDFELLCAGFPCQSFSVAGRRLGFQDTRGTVFFEIARIIAEKRPPFLLLENVPGLLSHDSGRTLTTIFSSLVEMGYHLEWMVLNSKYFGVPQQRRRLYIVGYLDARCAGKVFPLGSSYAKNLKQLIPGAQGQRVYETDGVACTQCASAGGWGGKTGLYFIDMNVNPKITEVARCITARQDSGVSNHRGEHSAVLIEDEPPRAMLTPDREKVRQQGRRIKEPDEPMFTITAQDKHGIYVQRTQTSGNPPPRALPLYG
jgi:DNA (cytosine-5)-methyltransferase 1